MRVVASLRVRVAANTACWYTPVLAYGASWDATMAADPENVGYGWATSARKRAQTIWILRVADTTAPDVQYTRRTPVPQLVAV